MDIAVSETPPLQETILASLCLQASLMAPGCGGSNMYLSTAIFSILPSMLTLDPLTIVLCYCNFQDR